MSAAASFVFFSLCWGTSLNLHLVTCSNTHIDTHICVHIHTISESSSDQQLKINLNIGNKQSGQRRSKHWWNLATRCSRLILYRWWGKLHGYNYCHDYLISISWWREGWKSLTNDVWQLGCLVSVRPCSAICKMKFLTTLKPEYWVLNFNRLYCPVSLLSSPLLSSPLLSSPPPSHSFCLLLFGHFHTPSNLKCAIPHYLSLFFYFFSYFFFSICFLFSLSLLILLSSLIYYYSRLLHSYLIHSNHPYSLLLLPCSIGFFQHIKRFYGRWYW